MKLLSLAFILFFCFEGLSKVGYVDFDMVFEQTKHGKSIKEKLKKEFEKKRSSIQKREKQLQEEQMKLNSEANLLSDSEKRKRLQSMQKKALEFQRSLESNERELEEYKNRLIASMEKNLKSVLAKMAQEKSFTKVKRITKDVLWIPKESDITRSVIRMYNKKYK